MFLQEVQVNLDKFFCRTRTTAKVLHVQNNEQWEVEFGKPVLLAVRACTKLNTLPRAARETEAATGTWKQKIARTNQQIITLIISEMVAQVEPSQAGPRVELEWEWYEQWKKNRPTIEGCRLFFTVASLDFILSLVSLRVAPWSPLVACLAAKLSSLSLSLSFSPPLLRSLDFQPAAKLSKPTRLP